MLRLRPDLLITRAQFERLDDDHWVALVTVAFPCGARGTCEREDLFALPEYYNPREDDGTLGADLLREHYMKEHT